MTAEETQVVTEQVDALERAGRVAEAILLLDRHLADGLGNRLLAYSRIRLFAGHYKPVDSLKEITGYRKRYPKDRSAADLEALVYFRAEKPQKALDVLDSCESTAGLTHYGQCLKVELLSELGRVVEARELAMAESSRVEPGLHDLIAEMALKKPTTEGEMLEFSESRRNLGDRDSNIAIDLAKWYLVRGDLARAEVALQDGLARSPHDPKLNYQMAGLAIQAGRNAEAFKRIREVFDRNPSDSIASAWLFHYYLRRLRLWECMRVFSAHVIMLRKLGFGPEGKSPRVTK